MKNIFSFVIAIFFSHNFILAQTVTLSEPLNSFSILSGTSVTADSATNVKGTVGAIGTVDSTIRPKDTTLQGSICVTQRALDSFNIVRSRLDSAQPAQTVNAVTLSNTTLTAGVRNFSSSLSLNGTITLTGDSASIFIFNVTGKLTFDAGSQLILIGGVKAENVFFNVDSSVAVKDSAVICGNILANGTICCSKDISAKDARLMSADSVCLVNSRDTIGTTPDKQLILFGSTCGCAIDLGRGDTCMNNITMSDSVMWFRFVADSVHMKITAQKNNGNIDSIKVFSGTCNGLQLFASASANNGGVQGDTTVLELNASGFTKGNNYFLKITGATNNINVCVFVLPPYTCSSSSVHNCNSINNYIKNGDFESGTVPTAANGIGNSYAECWIADYTTGTCNLQGTNSPDLFDILSPLGSYTLGCAGQQGVSIPFNFASNGQVNVNSTPNSLTNVTGRRYASLYEGADREQMSAELLPLSPLEYYLEFYAAPMVCGNIVPAICMQLISSSTGASIPLGSISPSIAPIGIWTRYSLCVDLTAYSQSTLSTIDRFAVMRSSSPSKRMAFDDFALYNMNDLANAGTDVTLACNGYCTTLGPTCTPVFGGIYYWAPGGQTTPSITVCPTVTTVYTLTFTDPSGTGSCSASDHVTVTVNPTPTVTITTNNQTICLGQNATLTASGGVVYYWNTGATTSAIIVSPSSTTSYSVQVANSSGCTAIASVTVFVNLTPNANAGADQTICSSSCATLTATGGGTYSWSPTGQTTPSITVCPTTITNYSVTATSVNGCSATDIVTVFVKPLPIINVGSNKTVCSGKCATLAAASSAGNYAWSPATGLSCTNCSNPQACPTATTTYTVTTTGANGCTASATVAVTVNPNPVANAGPDVTRCIGQACPTFSGSGGGTYLWSPATGLSCTNCSNPQACSTITTTYTLTVTNNFGCTNTDAVNVSVGTTPTVPVIVGNPNDCSQPSSTYSVTPVAGVSYSWAVSGGTIVPPATGTSVSVNWNLSTASSSVCPSTCKTGSITVTASNGVCSSTGTMLVFSCCKIYAGISLFDASNTSVLAVASTYSVFGSGPPFTVNNLPFTINGTFTVNANINFINCQINISPDSKIVINPGASLTLTSSGSGPTDQTILRAGTCCSVMWDGIYISGSTAHLITNSTGLMQTTIQDAKNAVVSNNGGDYQIRNTLLQRNNIDMVVNTYSVTHTGTIKKSKLIGTPPLLSYIVNSQCKSALPRTNIGVQINKVAGINVGVATPGNTNTFDNMDYGIYATASRIFVYNNTFQNINTTNVFGNPPDGISVYAVGGKFLPPAPPMGVTVGGIGLMANTFTSTNPSTNCGFGVVVQNFMPNISILRNTFQNNVYIGAGVVTCPNSMIDISANTFNNTTCAAPLAYAIRCTDVFNASATILNNTINQPCTTVTSATTGIYVANGVIPNMNLTIQDNVIANQRTGIWMINVSGPVTAMPLAVTNTITISKQASFYTAATPHYGIRLQGCSNVKVKQNTITQNAVPVVTPTFAMTKTLLGINVENSLGCIVGSYNTITKFGSGGYIFGMCNPSTLACNNLNSCYYGFNFDGPGPGFSAAVGDQIRDATFPFNPRPTANVWTGSISSDLGGNIKPIIWWFDNAPLPTSGGMQLGSLFGAGNTATLTTNNDICVQFKVPAQAQRGMLRRIVAQQNNYVSLIAQNLTLEHKYALKTLRENPQWMHQNNPDDTLFQNFYAKMMASNLGKLGLINDTIANGHINDAININNTIIDTNALDANSKTVNRIYLNTWAQGILEFSSADSAALLTIALQEPLEFGDAVYSARVMLGIDPANSGSRIEFNEENYSVANNMGNTVFSKVYPNPNNGSMQIEYELGKGKNGQMIIYDAIGNKIRAYILTEGSHTLSISDAVLQNGIYIYEIKVTGEVFTIDKIIVIK
ncbi:MAG: DUF3494 domain-containing protein [Bacteroidetes bacterium]|nr:DUF3494 domain-containing protein [Bacteroidota bacterium]